MSDDNPYAMPEPPEGYQTCRTMGGSMSLLAPRSSTLLNVQTTHLVKLNAEGRHGGPTVCGMTRFGKDADIPGWSMGGGVSGPGTKQEVCDPCYDGVI